MSKFLKAVPLYLLLLPVFFCLHGALENFGLIKPGSLANTGLNIFLAIAVLFAIVWLFTRKVAFAGIVSFSLSVWYLFFGAVIDWVKSKLYLEFMSNFSIVLVASLLVVLLFLFLLRKKPGAQAKIHYYLNILLLVYCLYDAAMIVYKNSTKPAAAIPSTHPFDKALVKQKPNVYYLLFDEYPGRKGLVDSFAFSNDSLYSFFNKAGFAELPVFSNYNSTFYSMSSILNMQYVYPLVHPEAIEQEDYELRRKEISHSKVLQCFMGMNYKIYNLSIFDIQTPDSLDGFHIPFDRVSNITDKIFHNRALSYYGKFFATGKFKIGFIRERYMLVDAWNANMEAKLNEVASTATGKPKFTYAHIFLPHLPIYRDSTGKYVADDVLFGPLLEIKKKDLLPYIKYTNKKIETIVNNLVAKDPAAIIVVMSDHGLRHYKSTIPKEPLFFDNICFARFPNKNYLPYKPKWSNVNFYPYLFNCQFNQHIPYVEDSTILILDKKLIESLAENQ